MKGYPSWISGAETAPGRMAAGNVLVITGCIAEICMACEQAHVRCHSPTRLQGARAGCPSALLVLIKAPRNSGGRSASCRFSLSRRMAEHCVAACVQMIQFLITAGQSTTSGSC